MNKRKVNELLPYFERAFAELGSDGLFYIHEVAAKAATYDEAYQARRFKFSTLLGQFGVGRCYHPYVRQGVVEELLDRGAIEAYEEPMAINVIDHNDGHLVPTMMYRQKPSLVPAAVEVPAQATSAHQVM